jgi:hypothetical protein
VEFFERVEMFADADELDRHAGDMLHREGRAAAGVAVELREDDAVEFQGFVERLGAVDRILAGHAVDHQQHLVGHRLAVDPLQLFHQRFVDVEPAGRVEDQHVGADLLRVGLSRLRHGDRILSASGRKRQALRVARQ